MYVVCNTVLYLKICNNVFAGGRTADEIVNWLLKKTGPVAKDLTSVDDAKGFVDASNVAVIGFFKVI
jgi:protein disulfide-isomerase A1